MSTDDDVMRGPYNHDICPPQEMIDQYPKFRTPIINAKIFGAFDGYERAANSWKRVYNGLGKGGLICIFIVMFALDARLVFHPPLLEAGSVQSALAVLAVVGIAMELALISERFKEGWLFNRYAAERIRCLKFEAFLLAGTNTVASFGPAVDIYTGKHLALLDISLNAGPAAHETFNPVDVDFPDSGSLASWDAGDREDFIAIHDKMRFEWQLIHFEKLAKAHAGRARLPSSVGGIVFIAGGVLAFLDLSLRIWPTLATSFGGDQAHQWLDFLTLLVFIASATIGVWERGGANRAHTDRYRRFAREIVRLRDEMHHKPPPSAERVMSIMSEMERACLHEMHDFLRDVRHSSYIF